jgi:hypothetical protein
MAFVKVRQVPDCCAAAQIDFGGSPHAPALQSINYISFRLQNYEVD